MKRIVCEMCGSKDFVKDNGFFVCESCGTKYTLEEAKKMMVEGTVEVKGTVAIDSSKAERDLLDVVETAVKAKNYDNVYSSACKLVEINPSFWKGWLYKGIGAGYTSKLADNRYQESIVCFNKAYEVADESERSEVKERIVNETFELSGLLIDFFSNSLVELPNETNRTRLINTLQSCFVEINILSVKYGTSYVLIHDFEDKKIFKIWNDLQEIKNNADSELGRGRENRTDWKFDAWLDKNDQVIGMLIYLLNGCPIRPRNVEPYLRFLQRTIRDTTHTCSYEYSAAEGKYVESKKLTRSAVKARNQIWEETNAKKDELIKKAEEREKKYQQTRFDEYWAAHSDEREELIAEKEELSLKRKPYTERIKTVEDEILVIKDKYSAQTADEAKEKELVDEIETNKKEIKKFKLFDFKGKKPFKQKLKELKIELKNTHKAALVSRQKANEELEKEINKLKLKTDGILSECSDIDKRLEFIENELTKAR